MAAAPVVLALVPLQVDRLSLHDFQIAAVGQNFYGLVNWDTARIHLVGSVDPDTHRHVSPRNVIARFQVVYLINGPHGGHGNRGAMALGNGHLFALIQNRYGDMNQARNGRISGFSIIKTTPLAFTSVFNSGINVWRFGVRTIPPPEDAFIVAELARGIHAAALFRVRCVIL